MEKQSQQSVAGGDERELFPLMKRRPEIVGSASRSGRTNGLSSRSARNPLD